MSAASKLALLGGIFRASDALLIAKIPADQLNQVLWRWKAAGYVRQLGARTDVWFNLVVDPNVTRERWEEAFRLALPSAVLAGHSVLMRSGLSTQMAATEYMIQPPRTIRGGVDGVDLHERPALWLRRLWQLGAVDTSGTLPHLDPGAAAADLLRFDPDSIDVDELDWDELAPKSRRFFDALKGDADEEMVPRRLPKEMATTEAQSAQVRPRPGQS